MNKVIDILKKNWLYFAGAIFGVLAGYLYWYHIGCADGTCPITSSPTMSMTWGAAMGSLLFGLFQKESKM